MPYLASTVSVQTASNTPWMQGKAFLLRILQYSCPVKSIENYPIQTLGPGGPNPLAEPGGPNPGGSKSARTLAAFDCNFRDKRFPLKSSSCAGQF